MTQQTQRSRELRRALTLAESLLWQELRYNKIGGLKFRRQQSIDHFIVDFYCSEKRLLIEVDGEIHNLPENQAYDRERQIFLEALGLTIVRFTNHDIQNHMVDVINKIQ